MDSSNNFHTPTYIPIKNMINNNNNLNLYPSINERNYNIQNNNTLNIPLISPTNNYPSSYNNTSNQVLNPIMGNSNVENYIDGRYKEIILSTNSFYVSRRNQNFLRGKIFRENGIIDCFPKINGIKSSVPIIQMVNGGKSCCCEDCLCCCPYYDIIMGINYSYFTGFIQNQYFAKFVSNDNKCCCKSCCSFNPIEGVYLDNYHTSLGRIEQIDSFCCGHLHNYHIYDNKKLQYILKYKTNCETKAILEDTVGNIVGTIANENACNKKDFSYNITFPPNSSFEMRCLLLGLMLKVHIDVN